MLCGVPRTVLHWVLLAPVSGGVIALAAPVPPAPWGPATVPNTVCRTHLWQQLQQIHMEQPRKANKSLTFAESKYSKSPSNRRLWFHYGRPGTMYFRRNEALAKMLGHVRPRRVFEFAGNGGFAAQAALRNWDVRWGLQYWLHSDFAKPALEHAAFLFSRRFVDPNLDSDRAKLAGWAAPALPYMTVIAEANDTRGRRVCGAVARVDLADPATLRAVCAGSRFDTVATISFEHFGNDLGLICALPPGTNFVFCVPNFKAWTHFRWFQTAEEIQDRYRGLLSAGPPPPYPPPHLQGCSRTADDHGRRYPPSWTPPPRPRFHAPRPSHVNAPPPPFRHSVCLEVQPGLA